MTRSSVLLLGRLTMLAGLSASLHAQATWIVDDTPGPGVHFPTIAAALAVAGPYDLVDVRPGVYGQFALTRPTRIIGAPGATVVGTSTVQALASGTWTFIADLSLAGLRAEDVNGTLLLDQLTLTGPGETLTLVDCSDVRVGRLRAVAPAPGSSQGAQVVVDGGRAQLVDCAVEGNRSPDTGTYNPTPGAAQIGLAVRGGAFVHLDRCTVRGGRGGDNFDTVFPTSSFADSGGAACEVSGGSVVLCVESLLRGGDGGFSHYGWSFNDGRGGVALHAIGGAHRSWHTLFEGGLWGGSSPQAPGVLLLNGATLDTTLEQPSLVPIGDPLASAPITLELRAVPGSSAQLLAARLPVLVAIGGASLPRLVDLGRTVALGTVPTSGLVAVPLTLGPWPRGTVLFLQGGRTGPLGLDFTSAAALIVR